MARSEEEKKRRAEYLKAYRADPNSAYNTPESKAKREAYQKAYWAKPENAARRAKTQKESKARAPEEVKARHNEYMKRYYRENTKYNADAKRRAREHEAKRKAEDPVEFLRKKAEYTAAYRARHPEKYRAQHATHARDARLRARAFVVHLKSTTPCKDCGQILPSECMDFDHLRDKEIEIAHLVSRGATPERLMKEISKTEIVCSNCHRTRTVKRRNGEGIDMEEAI